MSSIYEFQITRLLLLSSNLRISKTKSLKTYQEYPEREDSKDEYETSARNTAWHHQVRVQTEHGVAADTK